MALLSSEALAVPDFAVVAEFVNAGHAVETHGGDYVKGVALTLGWVISVVDVPPMSGERAEASLVSLFAEYFHARDLYRWLPTHRVVANRSRSFAAGVVVAIGWLLIGQVGLGEGSRPLDYVGVAKLTGRDQGSLEESAFAASVAAIDAAADGMTRRAS